MALTLDEMLHVAGDYHARGDAIGLYRFLRERIDHATTPEEEGGARTVFAEALDKWHLGTPAAIRSELARAHALLRNDPDGRAFLLLVEFTIWANENNLRETQRVLAVYERLYAAYPHRSGVTRWRGRFSQWQGRLALMRNDPSEAERFYELSISELNTYEPDPGFRDQFVRMNKLRLVELAFLQQNWEKARRYLDECEGATFSRLWETGRACAEVRYAIEVGRLDRARFWLGIAQSWATPQTEAATLLALAQAQLSFTLGELQKAQTLTLEARRLAAVYKQDFLLPEIREFFRVQTAGVRAGPGQGGITDVEVLGRVAVARPVPRPRLRRDDWRL